VTHLVLRPITLRAANGVIARVHRHHGPVRGAFWALSAWRADQLVGVATAGRPVAEALQDGLTFEVTRVATDGTRNACSFLYSAAWRVARAMGYVRGCTYVLAEESGHSLKVSGWTRGPKVPARSWDRPKVPARSWDRPKRRRVDKHPTGPKVRWQVGDWPPALSVAATRGQLELEAIA